MPTRRSSVFCNIVRNCLRDDDDGFFRLAGDQFALIMARSGVSEALIVVDRIKTKLRETPCYAGENDTTGKRTMVNIRSQFGITDCIEGDTPDSSLERADAALIRAKARDTSKGEGETAVQIIKAPRN